MAMGTNRFGARIREAKSTIGPSAPPIVAIDAASLAGRPNTNTQQQRGEGSSRLGEQSDNNAGPGGGAKNKADVAHCANAEENDTGDEAIAKGEIIDRLQ